MPLHSQSSPELEPGMFVELHNGAAGKVRAVYPFVSDLVPSASHQRVLLAMLPDGSKGDFKLADVRRRVTVRPGLAVVS